MEAKNSKLKKEDLKIVEGVESVWFYHLSVSGKNYDPALCGRREVMRTQLPISSWGYKDGNVPSKYCSKCNDQYNAMV
jgi:hypothetical protein